MSAEEVQSAMRPFVRTSSALGTQGSGLGLSTVRALCGTLNIELSLASEPGVGTTATLRLPSSSSPNGRPPSGVHPRGKLPPPRSVLHVRCDPA